MPIAIVQREAGAPRTQLNGLDTHFHIGLTKQEKSDMVVFLRAL